MSELFDNWITVFDPTEDISITPQKRDELVMSKIKDDLVGKMEDDDTSYPASAIIHTLRRDPLSSLFDADDYETPPLIESRVLFTIEGSRHHLFYVESDVKLRLLWEEKHWRESL